MSKVRRQHRVKLRLPGGGIVPPEHRVLRDQMHPLRRAGLRAFVCAEILVGHSGRKDALEQRNGVVQSLVATSDESVQKWLLNEAATYLVGVVVHIEVHLDDVKRVSREGASRMPLN